jgi:hypothetical protein
MLPRDKKRAGILGDVGACFKTIKATPRTTGMGTPPPFGMHSSEEPIATSN